VNRNDHRAGGRYAILVSRTVAPAASVEQQYELSAYVTLLADAVRLGDLGEREGLRDREREAPGRDQRADLGERVNRAAGGIPPPNVIPCSCARSKSVIVTRCGRPSARSMSSGRTPLPATSSGVSTPSGASA
jgi:hypothetical protein